jgi:uncharacterized membrane protein YcaP (DUF421 family)
MDVLTSLFQFQMNPVELVLRGTFMYWFLFLAFRFVLRRDAGGIGIPDILLIVLVADASQNAMAAEYRSVPEGLVLVSTLLAWNLVLDWAGYRWDAMRRFVEPRPLLLIRHGRVIHRNLRREFLTLDDLQAQLRMAGVSSISAVRSAFMEADGKLSVVLTEGARGERRSGHVRRSPDRDLGRGA